MRICLFRAFPDPYRKSMQIYANQLQSRLAPLLGSGEEVVGCLPPNVRLQPRLQRYWDQYLRYQRYVRRCHGDVNHIIDHSYGHLVRSLPYQSAVVTFHDSTVTKVKGVAVTTRASLRYSLHAMRRAARIVTDSENSRNDLLELIDYPQQQTRVVYPGIDPAFRPLADRERHRAALGLPDRYMLHVGHSLPYMNVEQVLRVLGRVVDRGLDLNLVKVGTPFTDGQSELIEQLGVGDRIKHLGRVSFEDLPAVYNCAAILLYPVYYAGFGLPPLEAIACGIPVVCSDRGSLPEVLGDAALFASPDETQEMAEHVARLLTDGTMVETYRLRGLERSRRYSWDHTARSMLEVYREVGHA
jgi:glycosyltransferase involved in cell wall biosynthesis